MTTKTLGSMKDMDVISTDAYRIGQIMDIRYDMSNWRVQSFKIKTEKNASKMLSSGSSKSIVALKPGDFMINDVMLLDEDIGQLGSVVEPDRENAPTLSFMDGRKVVSKENVIIGTVQDVNIDVDLWSVLSISVKLDKMAFEPLGLKKGLLSKTVIMIRSEYIGAVSDVIALNQSVMDMKDEIVIE